MKTKQKLTTPKSAKKKLDPQRHVKGSMKILKRQAIELARMAFILGRDSIKQEIKDRIGKVL